MHRVSPINSLLIPTFRRFESSIAAPKVPAKMGPYNIHQPMRKQNSEGREEFVDSGC